MAYLNHLNITLNRKNMLKIIDNFQISIRVNLVLALEKKMPTSGHFSKRKHYSKKKGIFSRRENYF